MARRRLTVAWATVWPVALVVALALAAALGLAVMLRPPPEDVQLLAVTLLLSGLLSLAAVRLVMRLGWRLRWGGLRLKIALAIAVGVLVALANVSGTALLMFLSPHDLALLGLLLGFALALSLTFGVVLAGALTGSLRLLTDGARRMAGGELSVRVAVPEGDEVGDLALAFNRMAEQIEAAFARQAELEAARKELVAAVSHDLRTPLASIQVMAEALQDGVVSDPETVQRYLRTMQGDIRYLNGLIADLVELSQLDAGALRLERQPVSLAELVTETVDSLQPQAAQKAIHLVGEADAALAPVVIDPLRVQRVLVNLLQNALRHTPPGGRVGVQAREAGALVEVRVTDSGEGIDAGALPRIFDRFYRADPSRAREHGGAGLGLAIARGLVEAHGGHIWAESTPGQGATFRFTLPTAGALSNEQEARRP